MFSNELIRKIRQIEIRTRDLVDSGFAGAYHSTFKGRGIEFDETRHYQPGDEIRTIDWNVTARMGMPYVKRFIEERELAVLLVVDASGSGDFGSVDRFKRELVAELSAVLAFAAIWNNDKVGLLIFTDRIERFIPPRKGRKHVLRLVRELLTFEPEGQHTDMQVALNTANRVLKQRSILFLISDFLIEPERYRQELAVTNRRHDAVAIEVCDPLETEIAKVGLLALEDAESGETIWVDTNHRRWRQNFQQGVDERRAQRKRVFNQCGVDRILLMANEDYVAPLMGFFQRRARRIARKGWVR